MDLADLVPLLSCPGDQTSLVVAANEALHCARGHRFPVEAGVPVLFAPGRPQPVHAGFGVPAGVVVPTNPLTAEIDPFVQSQVATTCGNLYLHLVGKLTAYPIPDIPLPATGPGQVLVDIGASWGRWSVAAARLGYRVVSVEPWAAAGEAAGRVARQLGVDHDVGQVRGDALALPFDDNSIDLVFSYSVIQHFSRQDAFAAFHEAARVLKPGGMLIVQMPNRRGLRQTWNRYRNSEEGQVFGVQMWSMAELASLASDTIGPAMFEVDGFLGLGVQAADLALLKPQYRFIVRSSLALKALAQRWPLLATFADSVWIRAPKRPAETTG